MLNDEQHQKIKEQIVNLENRINRLNDERTYNEAQHRALYLTKQSKDIDQQITQENRMKKLRTPQAIDAEIKNTQEEINRLNKEYWTTGFTLEDINLKTKVTYENDQYILKQDAHGGRWWLYIRDVSTALPSTIIFDENNKPCEVKIIKRDSETRGYTVQTSAKITIDKPIPQEPEKPRAKPKKIEPLRVWQCKCGYKNYFELLQCQVCRAERPNDWDKKKELVENDKVSMADNRREAIRRVYQTPKENLEKKSIGKKPKTCTDGKSKKSKKKKKKGLLKRLFN